MKKERKGNWIVTIRATVTKEVCVENCTESEARENPFDHAEDEREIDQVDYKVLGVQPND